MTSTRVAFERRSKAEYNAYYEGKRSRRSEHVPVQIRVQSEIRPAVGQQPRKETNAPDGEEYAHGPAERPQDDAFS